MNKLPKYCCDKDHVYEPSEDTFLLMDSVDVLVDECKFIPKLFVEIGSGSGIVSSYLLRKLGKGVSFGITTDINPRACKNTLETSSINNVCELDSINTMFIDSASERLRGRVDLVLCNPPYVPTDSTESVQSLSASWAGGYMGVSVILDIIKRVPHVLRVGGTFLLLVSRANNPDFVIEKFLKINGRDRWSAKVRAVHIFTFQTIIERRAGCEYLVVIQFIRIA